MKIANFLGFFLSLSSYFSTCYSFPHFFPLQKYQNYEKRNFIPLFTSLPVPEGVTRVTPFNPIWYKKTCALFKLARYKNIPPTLLLTFTGGILSHPSLNDLIRNPTFLIASLNTVLIMLNSMVINDLFDINTDRINYPYRPLVTGEITLREARVFSLFLIFLTECLSIRYLPRSLQRIIHLALVQILLYTPVLKRIPLIKNLSCALLVSFAIYFGGLSTKTSFFLFPEIYSPLLSISTSFIFLGSFYNELLLDMKDVEGDKKTGIWTLPVFLGKPRSWKLAKIILSANVFMNTARLVHYLGFGKGLLFLAFCSPLFYELEKIKKKNYHTNVIRKVVQKTNGPLFLVLLGLVFASLKR